MKKRTNPIKVFFTSVKKIFRTRTLIIISEQKVDHVPLSGIMQILILIGFFGFFSGVSYITGSYMTARSVIKDKDQKIVANNIEKVRINEEMNLLKHDLIKLSQNGKDLTSYSQFIADQQFTAENDDSFSLTPLSNESIFSTGGNKLADKVAFLEKRISEIKNENEKLVLAIRERTDKKISDFEDIIAMTGLNTEKLERMAKSGKSHENIADETSISPINDKTSQEKTSQDDKGKGGPFIPDSSFNASEQEILANVDKMVLLHGIIEKLPLAKPIDEAQLMSPFGRRLDPFNGRWAMHPGLDMAGATGSKIYSTNDGVIVFAGRKPAYGNVVDVQHKFGIVTRYAHLSKIVVKEGQKISKGQQVGVQGSTGRSTGQHLHYEVRVNDSPINPIKFLNAGEYVQEN